MDSHYTDVIAVFDIGRSSKRFVLFDGNLNVMHTDEKIIGEVADSEDQPCQDLPEIEQWIRSCLSGVTSRGQDRILAVSIAGSDDCFPALESDVIEMLKRLPWEMNPCQCKGISSTTASMIPYMKGSDRPFILVSTGKWCTFMNPFDREPFPEGHLREGVTDYMTIGGEQVRSSRFHLGEVHDRNVAMLDDHFGVTGELYKTIKIKSKKIVKIQSGRRGRTFFRHGIPEGFADRDANLSHFLTYADAYHQMMYDLVDECMGSYRDIVTSSDTTEIVYVTGGFARNDTFVRILAARMPDKRVFTSQIENATALGAALTVYESAFGTSLPPLYLGLKAIIDND